MKKIILFILIVFVFNSCNSELKGFEFNNFDNTPVSDLANAVRENDVDLIKKIAASKKIDIDYKEPVYMQTLLTLAIVNEKKDAFIALLDLGANPNILLGKSNDSTPFTESIIHHNKCNLFYVKNLLKYGANPNLEIIPNDSYYFSNNFPLLTAIKYNPFLTGDDCLDLIRLLVDNGANIYCCANNSHIDICDGVIRRCLLNDSMQNLRYFVIEKKMIVPKFVYQMGGSDKTVQKYSLTEILNSEDYRYEDFEDELGKHNFSKERKIRNEILEYLKKTGQQ